MNKRVDAAVCLPGEIGRIICSVQLLRMDSVQAYCPRSAHKLLGLCAVVCTPQR